MRRLACLLALWPALFFPGTALAYIGPGAGLTAIGSVLAFVGVVVLLIAGFVWYPVKRLIIRLRRGSPAGTDGAAGGSEP